MLYKVAFSVVFETEVDVKDTAELKQHLSLIRIPESALIKYRKHTFQIEGVLDGRDREIVVEPTNIYPKGRYD